MRPKDLTALVATIFVAFACNGEPAGDAIPETPPGSRGEASPTTRAQDVSTRSEADEPVEPAEPTDPTGAEAAVAVIRQYYDAIDRRDYARAYALWAEGGAASGQSFDEFRRGFAGTASVEVEFGEPGRIEPAAGSRFIRVPVVVRAVRTDGGAQCFHGTYTLQRSVVPGATPEQRRWRIRSADIAPCTAVPYEEGATHPAASTVERFGDRLERLFLPRWTAAAMWAASTRIGPPLGVAVA